MNSAQGSPERSAAAAAPQQLKSTRRTFGRSAAIARRRSAHSCARTRDEHADGPVEGGDRRGRRCQSSCVHASRSPASMADRVRRPCRGASAPPPPRTSAARRRGRGRGARGAPARSETGDRVPATCSRAPSPSRASRRAKSRRNHLRARAPRPSARGSAEVVTQQLPDVDVRHREELRVAALPRARAVAPAPARTPARPTARARPAPPARSRGSGRPAPPARGGAARCARRS